MVINVHVVIPIFVLLIFQHCPYHPLSSITDNKHDCCSQLISTFDILQANNRMNGCQQREHICQKQNYLSEIYENLDKMELIKHHPSLRSSSIDKNRPNVMVSKIIEQSVYGTTNSDVEKRIRYMHNGHLYLIHIHVEQMLNMLGMQRNRLDGIKIHNEKMNIDVSMKCFVIFFQFHKIIKQQLIIVH